MVSKSTEKISEYVRERRFKKPVFSIKLAPLDVPPERRLQTLSVFGWVCLVLAVGPISWAVAAFLAYNTFWGIYAIFAYLFYMYMDWEICEKGGRRLEWFRKLKWWEYFRDFFPVKLVKTVDLPPDQNYLFAAYPHGILSSGVFASFATDALKFEDIFEGLKSYPCTLNLMFRLPVIREYVLASGLNSVSEKSINWILGSPGKGRAAVVVVGGAAEALYNKPGTYKIILEKRKGFCRLALENGSPLVPVFSFGETDLFEQVYAEEGSLLESFQTWFKKKTGVAPVLFFGRGIFNYSFGILPRRKPVTVVVGKPIQVEKVENPTREQINELHKKFRESLVALFNEQKHIYLEDPNTELIIS